MAEMKYGAMEQIKKQAHSPCTSSIDRYALVRRHAIRLTAVDFLSPLSVGNGEFCFTADITGLQTFEADYTYPTHKAIPLSTMSDWGWHHKPNPEGYSWEKFPLTPYNSHGREVGYLYYSEGNSPTAWRKAANWLYSDPNHFHLGRIGLALRTSEGRAATIDDISNICQDLDLWTGVLTSRFTFDGYPVQVTTVCHGTHDQIAVTIESALIADGRLKVTLAFPYSSGADGSGADWTKPDAHHTVQTVHSAQRADFARTLDTDTYHVALAWQDSCTLTKTSEHVFLLSGNQLAHRMAFTCAFSRAMLPEDAANVSQTLVAAQNMWKDFWTTGGAIDLSESTDSRWYELERRIVLSLYLTRIQSAGTLPPQETGLTSNSWHGKFHMEMYWWHAAHYPLWGRQQLLEKSMPFYTTLLPVAQKIAKDQGYDGARWPKCLGPEGYPAPTYLEAFLLWQQPHPLFLAELCYRTSHDPLVLGKYQEIVFETAKFMESFSHWDETRQEYIIGAPLADAAEIYFGEAATNWNLNFENAYWHFGLEIAQTWRERLGLARNEQWDHILEHLPSLAVKDGVYVAGETQTGTWVNGRQSHPDVVGPLGIFDGAMVDHDIMRVTLNKVMNEWDWSSAWGWDFPEVAMCAARLGEGKTAIDALLMDTPKNTYLPNGHNWQMDILPLYLPGNGGLLYTVALMAAGWDGAPDVPAPGFPQDGTWVVTWEGLFPAPADYQHC